MLDARDQLMLATLRASTAKDAEIKRLRALLAEVRGDINDYGFSDSFADETHKTLAKIDIGLAVEQTGDGK